MRAHDVVIAGGGPTGLMLACELSLSGVCPLVLERLPAPTGLSKALGFGGRAVDLLDHRGLLHRFEGSAPPGMVDIARLIHFGGLPLDLGKAKGFTPRFVPLLQARAEAILEERARELGVEIQRGDEVVGVEQHPDRVVVRVRNEARERALDTSYLVGCDGGRSSVRKLAGIAFPGSGPTMLLRLGDVELPGLAPDARLPFGMLRIEPDVFRVTTLEAYPEGLDRNAEMTLKELEESVRRVHGVDLPLARPRWLSRFTDASRQAASYRVGRVFLAGDAAHVHLPAGGPGLSTGLNDAANLGWKLAAAIRGWAPAGLLDSYHAERHPAGSRVLMHTRVQAALMRPGEHRQAMRELFAELLQDEATILRIGSLLAGDVRYQVDPGAGEAHPLLGRWAPDLPLITGRGQTRVAALMQRARGVLLELAGRKALAGVATPWVDRVDVIEARCAEVPPPAEALLIRPDGYVAWVPSTGASPDVIEGGLRTALERWFGAPAMAHREPGRSA